MDFSQTNVVKVTTDNRELKSPLASSQINFRSIDPISRHKMRVALKSEFPREFPF